MSQDTPAKPPREFLILYRESNRMFNSYRIDDSQLANEHLNDQTYRNAGIPQREAIHVIEKSYASRLEQELAFVKTQWKQTSDLLEQERNRLTAELAEMRRDWGDAERRLHDKYAAALVERDQALAQAAALADALEDICHPNMRPEGPAQGAIDIARSALADWIKFKEKNGFNKT